VNPETPGQGCRSASTGRGLALADGWVLAAVLLVALVHADAAANTAAAAAAGSQNLGVTQPSTPQRRIQLLSVRYPGARPDRSS
jgi:hypothetical protein